MSKSVEPGDVNIKQFTISNKTLSASLNAIDQLVAADIWEDVSKPSMFATFTFQDGINLLKNFPIIGEETITIEIQTPGISKPTVFVFRVFEIANVATDPNGKGTVYTLRCVSEEHLRNGAATVLDSQTGTVDNMITHILDFHFKTKKAIIMDPAKGIQTINFPYLNPFKAIDMLRQRAVSKDYVASSYLFFENQAGYNFKTIEGLIKEGKKNIGSREFNVQQNPNATKESVANAFRTILKYENLSKADANKKAAEGVFKAITKTFDLNTKDFSSSDFNMKDVFSKLQTPNNKAQIPNTDDFINNVTGSLPKQFFAPLDTSRPDTFIDTAIAARNSFAVLLNSEVTRILIHGDSGLKAGDLLNLSFPDPSGTTGKKKPDSMISGNYIILRLRHMITPSTKSKHQIACDCAKMGI